MPAVAYALALALFLAAGATFSLSGDSPAEARARVEVCIGEARRLGVPTASLGDRCAFEQRRDPALIAGALALLGAGAVVAMLGGLAVVLRRIDSRLADLAAEAKARDWRGVGGG